MASLNSTIAANFTFLPARYRKLVLPVIVGGLVVVSALLIVLQLHENSRLAESKRLNTALWQMNTSIAAGEIEEAAAQFDIIKNEGNQQQIYFALLQMGYGQHQAENYAEAAVLFSEAIAITDSKALRDTARIRLAKTMQSDDKYDEALALMLEIESLSGSFVLISESISGDIYLTQDKLADSAHSYKKALVQAKQLNDRTYLRLLETKIAAVASLRLQRGDVEPLAPAQQAN